MRLRQAQLMAGTVMLVLTWPLAAQSETVAGADAIRVLLAADRETTLVAQMNGRIELLNANLGQAVARDAQIVAMDCGEPRARLHMAEAELAAANETHAAKTGLQQLNAAGDMEVALANAEVEKARGAVSLNRSLVAYCTANAPYDSRIARIYVKQYQGVSAGAPLVDLVSDGPLKLRLNVPSLYLRQLELGTAFDVAVNETGKTYPAKVTAINARIDAVAQTVELEARIDGDPEGLLAGMSGIAHFPFTP